MHVFERMTRLFGDRMIGAAPLVADLPGEAGVDDAAEPRRFTLVNHASDPIAAVYVKPADARAWGGDLLRGRPLGAGESVAIRPRRGVDATRIDLWVEYASGLGQFLRGVELGAGARIGVTEFGVRQA